MKKYIIHDGENEYSVIETEVAENSDEPIEEELEVKDDTAFSAEEIEQLKRVIAIFPDLEALVKRTPEETTDSDEDETEELRDEDEDEDKEKKASSRDSKKSFGAIDSLKTVVEDSIEDEVANAWIKRYGGR